MPTLFKLTRRALTIVLFTATLATAQTYPSKPIEWLVPYMDGGPTGGAAYGQRLQLAAVDLFGSGILTGPTLD
jgi:hypothetical protein